MGVVTYEILCEHCGTEFEARSTKRLYCSTKCRTAASRHKHRTPKQEAYSIIARVLDRAMQSIGFDNESDEIQAELRKFRDQNW